MRKPAQPHDEIVIQASIPRIPKTGGLHVQHRWPASPPIGAWRRQRTPKQKKGASREGRPRYAGVPIAPSENPRTPRVLVTLPPAHGEYQARRRGGGPTSGAHPHRYPAKLPRNIYYNFFRRSSENSIHANFGEPPQGEVPRITLPRTPVNKDRTVHGRVAGSR
jgi:hypothetical protein